MDRQARNGDTVLVKSRDMTGRTQTLPWRLGGEGGGGREDERKQMQWPRWFVYEDTV